MTHAIAPGKLFADSLIRRSCQVTVAADLSDHLLENTLHLELQFGLFCLCALLHVRQSRIRKFCCTQASLLRPGQGSIYPIQTRNRPTRDITAPTSRAASLHLAIIQSVQEFQQPPTQISYTRLSSSSLQSSSRPPPISPVTITR